MKENPSGSEKKIQKLFLRKEVKSVSRYWLWMCEEHWCCSPKQSAIPGLGGGRRIALLGSQLVGWGHVACFGQWVDSRNDAYHFRDRTLHWGWKTQHSLLPVAQWPAIRGSLLSHPGSLRQCHEHSRLVRPRDVGEQQSFMVLATRIMGMVVTAAYQRPSWLIHNCSREAGHLFLWSGQTSVTSSLCPGNEHLKLVVERQGGHWPVWENLTFKSSFLPPQREIEFTFQAIVTLF